MLLLSAALLCAAGGITAHKITAQAETEVGQYLLEMTDLSGEVRKLPAWYDGETYLLEDHTRNIYMHNGFEARTRGDIVAGVNRFPVYSSKKGEFKDATAVSLYANIIDSYDFYCAENIGEDHFGLLGKDDKVVGNLEENGEMPIHGFTHFNSESFRFNATCFSEKGLGFLLVGDGDKTNTIYDMYRQAACLDIIGHEFQHGIARFLNQGFTYEGESGALDEAFADIFGMLISGEDPRDENFWKIGEGCTLSGVARRRVDFPSKSKDSNYRTTIRSKYVCRKHSRGGHNETCDNDYVHHNSTIVSHVQYTAWEIAPASFTKSVIGTLWFNTLKLLGKDATFDDFAAAIRKVAEKQLDETAKNALDYSLYTNGFISDVMHKITFVDEAGEALFYAAVPHGGSLNEVVPQFKDSDRYDYRVEVKDGALQNITEDVTVTVSYEKSAKNFTVRFLQDDGTLIEEKVLPYGSTLVYPDAPQKQSDPEFDYTFSGWEGGEETVTKDMTVYAVYDKTPISEGGKKSNWPLILGICGGAVVLIGATTAVLLVKRRK